MVSKDPVKCPPGQLPLYKVCDSSSSYVQAMNGYRNGQVNLVKLYEAMQNNFVTKGLGYFDAKKMIQTHLYDISLDKKNLDLVKIFC